MRARALVLGLLAFLLALLAVLPARWVAGMLPAVVQCADTRGTVWRGRCHALTVSAPGMRPVTLETVGWTLHPLPLLRATLSTELVLTDARGDASGHVELRRKGLIVVRNVSARALFDRNTPSAMPSGWSGRVEVAQLELDWQANQLRHLQGQLRFFGLRDEQDRELGDYQLSFPPSAAPPFTGQLSDLGGPFELAGVLTLTMDRRWSLSGSVGARPGADPGMTSYLQVLGAPDSGGHYPLSAEGSFR